MFVFTQLPQRALGEFEQPGGVAGQPVFPFESRFFVRGKFGGGDFAGLMAEQVELLSVSLFVHDQGRLLRFERATATNQFGETLL